MADAQRTQDARAGLDAARRAYHDARTRVWSGAPGAAAVLEEAARRYARAVEALQTTADGSPVNPLATERVSTQRS